jgi:hypothetical protein
MAIPAKNQARPSGTHPCLKRYPLLSEKITGEDVADCRGSGSREVVKEKGAPWHIRHASEYIAGGHRLPQRTGGLPRMNPAPKRIVFPGNGTQRLFTNTTMKTSTYS